MDERNAEISSTVNRDSTVDFDGNEVNTLVQIEEQIQKSQHVNGMVSNSSRKSRKKKKSTQVEKNVLETSRSADRNGSGDGVVNGRTREPLGYVEVKVEAQEMSQTIGDCSNSSRKQKKRFAEVVDEIQETWHTMEEENTNAGSNPKERRKFLKTEEQIEETSQAVEQTSNVFPRKKKKKKFKPLNIEEALPWHRKFKFSRDDIKRLKELADIELKGGRFTEEEDAQIKKNWNAYSNYYKLDFFDVFYCGHRQSEEAKAIRATHVYAELARGLPYRTACSVASRARVILHPHYDIHSRYTQTEKDRIMKLKDMYGKDWNKIAVFLQRTPASVSQHYARMMYKKGPFSTEEKSTILGWIRETYGEEQADMLSSKDIDWKRMQQEVMRHRFPWQLKLACPQLIVNNVAAHPLRDYISVPEGAREEWPLISHHVSDNRPIHLASRQPTFAANRLSFGSSASDRNVLAGERRDKGVTFDSRPFNPRGETAARLLPSGVLACCALDECQLTFFDI
ncbi:Transcription termination factor 1 [Trichuris trichiura]|uniref:Transcription termination factor 1 n=1 Tax=Trichuris trichiura TaxID=36087 RepID=A0A077Z663_TRITR|nr:Transcription termination factor 1 [Trichuris trichiura]